MIRLVRGKIFLGWLLTNPLLHSMDALVWPIAPKRGHVIQAALATDMAGQRH
jgi:hypothetical protein